MCREADSQGKTGRNVAQGTVLGGFDDTEGERMQLVARNAAVLGMPACGTAICSRYARVTSAGRDERSHQQVDDVTSHAA